jgi:beta-1,4-mannooligosaccharide/beta-1,4-mannosyl-N-acetylglucosamine phosphorylase
MNEHVFVRCSANPLITPDSLPFEAAAVYNPGVAQYQDHVVLLLRVEDDAGYSSIYAARSRNGISDWEIAPKPLLKYGEKAWRYEQWGCEDARATYVEEEDRWYITYTAYSPTGPAIGLAATDDFVTAKRVCLLPFSNDKDGALFPCKFDGKWAILHRPDAGGHEHIWSAFSYDLIHWGEPHCVLMQGDGAAWDAVKVGAGPPPILTDQGWLLIYHGVKRYGGDLVYRVGAALLDTQKPFKIIGRCDRWIFQASADYEARGFIPNSVFPSGAILRGDELWLYYGAADTCVCLAIAKLADILAYIHP